MSEDDEVPHLSAETFSVLQEFYKEQEERENKLKFSVNATSVDDIEIEEDWQLSQFWYDDETIEKLVDITLKNVGLNDKIALISCPTLYKKMKEKSAGNHEIHLYEFDKRFAAYGQDFLFYDYNSPLNVCREKSGYYDIVLADPPFLSDECLTKTAITIKFFAKEKILLSTGAKMAELAERLLDVKKISFEPKHKNNLANEFWCFTNFKVNQ